VADERKLDFLRVLIAAAWADGELSYQELNNLKAYFRELELDNDELTALEPYLADPIDEREAATIVDDFLARVRGRERDTMLAAVRDMLLADGELAAGEKDFLDALEQARAEATSAGVFVDQLKRLWGKRGEPERDDRDDRNRRSQLLDEFVRNRVLYQVKRRLLVATGGAELDADIERELRWVCSLGALLGHVAAADQSFDADERSTIVEILDDHSTLQPRDIDVIVEIVESEVLANLGYFDFARELTQVSTPAERRQVISLLFAVAAADGEISHAEHEEIRKISMALNIDHPTFIAAKREVVPD
jgi:uncharacterized tellurite resistance protein B-like protein